MASSEKTRIAVYTAFFLAVIALGIFCQPTSLVSHPAAHTAAVAQK